MSLTRLPVTTHVLRAKIGRKRRRRQTPQPRSARKELQNCSPREGRGTPLDYCSDESSDLESQDMTNTKLLGGCSDVEVVSEKDSSPAVRDSTESVSSNPPSSGKRKENSDASEMDNSAGGSSSKGRTKRRQRSKFTPAEDEGLIV